MDYIKAIRELREEREKIDTAIRVLEGLVTQRSGKALAALPAALSDAESKRRGRKSMSPEERRKVSERMAAYWASRRSAKKGKG